MEAVGEADPPYVIGMSHGVFLVADETSCQKHEEQIVFIITNIGIYMLTLYMINLAIFYWFAIFTEFLMPANNFLP